jgi:hypothetical protein
METSVPTLPTRKKRIPKEIWEAVREGVLNGVSFDDLAHKYCIPVQTIRARASTKSWTTPNKFRNEVARQMTVSAEKLSAPAPTVPDWVDAASKYRQMLFEKVRIAVEAMELESPTTWRDAEIADRIARKAVGLESGEVNVVQTIIPLGGDFGVERDVSPPVR